MIPMDMGYAKPGRLPLSQNRTDGFDIDISRAGDPRIKYHRFRPIQEEDGTFYKPQIIKIILYMPDLIYDHAVPPHRSDHAGDYLCLV
jgi:hypothetical protein